MDELQLGPDLEFTPGDGSYASGYRVQHTLLLDSRYAGQLLVGLDPLEDQELEWHTSGEGFLLPSRFKVQVELLEQHDLGMRFEWFELPEAGLPPGPYLRELRVLGYRNPRTVMRAGTPTLMPITSTSLHQLRVAPLERLAVLAATHIRDSDVIRPARGSEWRTVFEKSWDAPSRRQGKRLTDDHYERVAEVYRSARLRKEPPRKAVMAALHGSTQSAARWIREARDRGLLDPPRADSVTADPSGTPSADASNDNEREDQS